MRQHLHWAIQRGGEVTVTSLSLHTHALSANLTFSEGTHWLILPPGGRSEPVGRMSKFGGLTNLISFYLHEVGQESWFSCSPWWEANHYSGIHTHKSSYIKPGTAGIYHVQVQFPDAVTRRKIRPSLTNFIRPKQVNEQAWFKHSLWVSPGPVRHGLLRSHE